MMCGLVSFQGADTAPVVLPKLEGVAQGGLQLPRKDQRQAGFGFLNRAEVFQEMTQTFLLFDAIQGPGLVTAAAVGPQQSFEQAVSTSITS